MVDRAIGIDEEVVFGNSKWPTLSDVTEVEIADRWLPAQHCISFCAFLCGVLLWVLADLRSPWPIFLASLGFWFFMVPVLSLGTAVTFRHLQHPEREFGPVRMWGTLGWVAANGWYDDGSEAYRQAHKGNGGTAAAAGGQR